MIDKIFPLPLVNQIVFMGAMMFLNNSLPPAICIYPFFKALLTNECRKLWAEVSKLHTFLPRMRYQNQKLLSVSKVTRIQK